MADARGEIEWFKPHRRAIIPIGNFKRSKSLRKSARRFEHEFDRDFETIMDACSARNETWISPELKVAYI